MEKYRKEDKTSYSLGMSLTIEALKHRPKQMIRVYLSDKAANNHQLSYLVSLCENNHVEMIYDDRLIEKLSLKENCYCIGVFNKFYDQLSNDDHIVAYRFNDFGELGTIMRSSVSFDFKNIVLIDCDLDYFDPRCIRASMGSIFHCNIVHYANLDSYLKDYKDHYIYPFGSTGKPLESLQIKRPFSLILSQDNRTIDESFTDKYYIEHSKLDDISLSIRSSIILSEAYYLKRKR